MSPRCPTCGAEAGQPCRTVVGVETPIAHGLRRRTPLRRRRPARARPTEPLAERCEAAIRGTCTGRAEHRHHLLRRSQGGTDDPANTIDICGPCHGWTHDHPADAVERGLLQRTKETQP